MTIPGGVADQFKGGRRRNAAAPRSPRSDTHRRMTEAEVRAQKVSMVHSPGCPDPSKAHPNCECGANVSCLSCGWGSGAWPCKCMRAKLAARRV